MRLLSNASFARVGGGLTYVRAQLEALAAEPGVELTVISSPWNHDALVEAVGGAAEVVDAGLVAGCRLHPGRAGMAPGLEFGKGGARVDGIGR